MDTDRCSKSLILKRLVILAAAGLLALCAARTSAYLTDRTQSDGTARTAFMDFSTHGHGAEADLSAEQMHLKPFEKGESFQVSFRTVYNGDTDCYVLPGLLLRVENADGSALSLSDGTETKALKDKEARLISGPFLCQPGDPLEYIYTVTVEEAPHPVPLQFDYAFSLAAVQVNLNGSVTDGSFPKEAVFEDILHRYKGEETASVSLRGFTAWNGPEKVWDKNLGMPAGTAAARLVELTPVSEPGNSPACTASWYMAGENGPVMRSPVEEAALTLRMNSLCPEASVRYELENEAGIAASPIYIVRLKGEEIDIDEEQYIPDHSD